MPKKQLPQPRRSEFDKTDLLKRIADLEERLTRLENRVIFGSGTYVGAHGGPATFGGSGVRI